MTEDEGRVMARVPPYDPPKFRVGQRIVVDWGFEKSPVPNSHGTITGVKTRFAATPKMRKFQYTIELDKPAFHTWRWHIWEKEGYETLALEEEKKEIKSC